jgi:hypothetical protein
MKQLEGEMRGLEIVAAQMGSPLELPKPAGDWRQLASELRRLDLALEGIFPVLDSELKVFVRIYNFRWFQGRSAASIALRSASARLGASAARAVAPAYEGALKALRLADRQDPITELVARKIIGLAVCVADAVATRDFIGAKVRENGAARSMG